MTSRHKNVRERRCAHSLRTHARFANRCLMDATTRSSWLMPHAFARRPPCSRATPPKRLRGSRHSTKQTERQNPRRRRQRRLRAAGRRRAGRSCSDARRMRDGIRFRADLACRNLVNARSIHDRGRRICPCNGSNRPRIRPLSSLRANAACYAYRRRNDHEHARRRRGDTRAARASGR